MTKTTGKGSTRARPWSVILLVVALAGTVPAGLANAADENPWPFLLPPLTERASGASDGTLEATTTNPIDVFTYWATIATASSEYTPSPGPWSASQATGQPDVYPVCGDHSRAWAPLSSGSDPEWLKVTYIPPAAGAARVDIYETKIGGFVTDVELELIDGSTATIFTGPDDTSCAGILSIPFSVELPVVSVTIHTQAPGWEEIDAVGLAVSL